MLKLSVNGKVHSVEDVDPSTPLLWVLRDGLNLWRPAHDRDGRPPGGSGHPAGASGSILDVVTQ